MLGGVAVLNQWTKRDSQPPVLATEGVVAAEHITSVDDMLRPKSGTWGSRWQRDKGLVQHTAAIVEST